MAAVDFKDYYNEHADYVSLRDTSSEFYAQYVHEVDFWKNKYMGEITKNLRVDSVIEIGCATGILLSRFPCSGGVDRTGVDISSANIDCARAAFPQMEFHCGDAETLWDNCTLQPRYSLAILSDILEHVEKDADLLRLVGQHADHVVLNLPLEKCEENVGRQYGIEDRHGHLRWYDVQDARNLVSSAGMTEEVSVVRHYVCEPVFRKYLANKLFVGRSGDEKVDGIAKYIQEINEIEINPTYYKSNYFALLKSKG